MAGIRVFVKLSYEVFNIPGFFDKFHEFIGEFQIEQSIEESINKTFRIWFWTDKIEIKKGQTRQVEIYCEQKDSGLKFTIEKNM